ncbi:MAG TPA: hypothetical protein VJ184_12950, partial [Chryseolinea sp.]|nr:hypothetical protein [Chryseolinea sp.]
MLGSTKTLLQFLKPTIILILLTMDFVYAQSNVGLDIDSLFAASNQKPFNGVVAISANNKTKYVKYYGHPDLENSRPYNSN